jgi:hypothetical protein
MELNSVYLIKNANRILALKCIRITETCYLFKELNEDSEIWIEKQNITTEPVFFKYQILEQIL